MAAQRLVLILLIKALLLREGATQCRNDCGCSSSSATRCCLTVPESESQGVVVGTINSTEFINRTTNINNLGLILAQEGASNTQTFAISTDPLGKITTLEPIDHEENDCYILMISITSDTISSNVLVDIKIEDVNDNPPVFTMSEYTFEVPETTTSAPTLTCRQNDVNVLTATDDDTPEVNGNITYRVENSNLFHLVNTSTPCVTNIVNNSLDFDVPPTVYSFTLVATDSANTTLRSQTNVTYVLQNVNDNTPTFENQTYTIQFPELEPIGTEVFQFQAFDIDLEPGSMDLQYNIDLSSGVFEINQTTGSLTSTRVTDSRLASSYDLIVSASDGMNTGSTNVAIEIVDLNEPVTIIIPPEGIITEITEGNNSVSVVIFNVVDDDTDLANQNNTFAIIAGQDKFSLVRRSNNFYQISQIAPIDFEQDKFIQIIVQSTERGNRPIMQNFTFNLTVTDVNDNPPNLNLSMASSLFVFTEGSGEQNFINLGEFVVDPDGGENGEIESYRLKSVRTQFGVDLTDEFSEALAENTGILNPSFEIDRETVGNFLIFVVNITDRGMPSLSKCVRFEVTILDVNDNPPSFNQSSYTFHVTEEQGTGVHIGRVTAMDLDYLENGVVIYTMQPTTSSFSINGSTGEITGLIRFDREKEGKYSFSVGAQDTGSPPLTASNIIVTVIIDDINDNYPLFNESERTFSILTGLQPGSLVGEVIAYDADLQPQILYQLESASSIFSLPNNATGEIFLDEILSSTETYTVNVSAFNPGQEANKSLISVQIVMGRSGGQIILSYSIGGGAGFLIVLISVTVLLVICVCYRNKKFKQQYDLEPTKVELGNQNSILKIPTTGGMTARGRVTFKESVVETHYHDQSVINDINNTVRKESITKFDSSPRIIHQFTDEEYRGLDGEEKENNISPDPRLVKVTVPELEMSPRHGMTTDHGGPLECGGSNGMNRDRGMNGDLGDLVPASSNSFMYNRRPASPIVRVVRGYSQSTDGRNSMEEEEEEEEEDSTYSSDDASMVNNRISTRYGSNRPDLDIRYDISSMHSHQLELHEHLPPISHGQITNSSLAQLHAHNLAQLAEANRQQHYSSMPISEQVNTLTLTPRDHSLHTSISTHSSHSPPSPHHSHQHMGVASSPSHLHAEGGGGRNYPHPLVMPEAFPRDTTDIHRFPMGSYTDYGEASTYASTELDEALGFNLDAEPGFTSLTATDYEDTEL